MRLIDNPKNKISLLLGNDEEKDEDDIVLKNIEINIEKEKKELEEKNLVYMLLIKKINY